MGLSSADKDIEPEPIPTLEDAIVLAAIMHEGVPDKQGQPYILHVLRVMLGVREDLRIAAVLHDVVEDTDTTLADLIDANYCEPDVNLIARLTMVKGQSRNDYIAQICEDPDAILVKLADVRDNMSRIPGLTNPKERDRLTRKYEADLVQLNAAFAAHCE